MCLRRAQTWNYSWVRQPGILVQICLVACECRWESEFLSLAAEELHPGVRTYKKVKCASLYVTFMCVALRFLRCRRMLISGHAVSVQFMFYWSLICKRRRRARSLRLFVVSKSSRLMSEVSLDIWCLIAGSLKQFFPLPSHQGFGLRPTKRFRYLFL